MADKNLLHAEDVIFNKPSLKEFIRLIKNGSVHEIWPSTQDEFNWWNGINGQTPGYNQYINNDKGLTENKLKTKSLKTSITVKYGDDKDTNHHYTCVSVGSDITFENEVSYPKDDNGRENRQNPLTEGIDGTITIKVDGDYHYPLINNLANTIVTSGDNISRDSQVLTVGGLKSVIGTNFDKLGSSTIGSIYSPIYLDKGTFTVASKVVNGTYKDLKNKKGNGWNITDTGGTDTSLQAKKVFGAVFNDYAEYRSAEADPGRCIIENGDGTLSLSTGRLQLGANIVSDTYGFAIGETNEATCPVAVCGRVLVYPLESKELFTPGAAVCSGPEGTVSLMTREEIREWPDAIIGYVSEVPTYDTWGSDNVPVNGRIWIKIK